MDKTGRIKDVPEEIFTSYYIEDFRKLFEKTNTKYLANVATDGFVHTMREKIEQLPKKDWEAFVNWHFMTCERTDQQGLSCHLLYICKKK